MKLMLDLVVLAFQMDKTRVATLMLNNDLSQMNFKFLEGVQGALHLDLTHNGRAADKEAMYLKTNQFHIAQFAYLTKRMKEIQEGDGTLLDNSILMLTSSLFDGDAHGANQLPFLLTGKGGGTLKPGRVLDYLDKGDDQPQGVQPPPVADGPHGCEARPLRRRADASGRSVGPRTGAGGITGPGAAVAQPPGRHDGSLHQPPRRWLRPAARSSRSSTARTPSGGTPGPERRHPCRFRGRHLAAVIVPVGSSSRRGRDPS